MRSRAGTALALLLALLGAASLPGCGALNPYTTLPHPAAGQSSGTRVAICYNGLTTSREAAREAAEKECPADTVAEPDDTDYYLQYCPLLLPARTTFVCVPGTK